VIELVAYWEGRLTTKHLCETFGIGRQQASKDINDYLRDHGPKNLFYDGSAKGYRPTPKFNPRFISRSVNEYLQWLTSTEQSIKPEAPVALSAHGNLAHAIEVIHPARNTIGPELLAPIVEAIRASSVIETRYVSLANPKPETRRLGPHTLVFAGNRWHLRAYCCRNHDFRDFVLTRFRSAIALDLPAPKHRQHDDFWQEEVTIKLIPDTRLVPAQRKIIAHDYGMTRNMLAVRTRAALVSYVLKSFGLDPAKIEARPEAQQLMIKNLAEVERWLFY
jgi:predicted DNA-binding transcriptional regulator YafY